MSRAIDSSARPKESLPTVFLAIIAIAVIALLIVAIALVFSLESDEFPETNYGFEGEVRLVGALNHEIVYGEGISEEILYSLGEYFERIEYFNPAYGGIMQIRVNDIGYTVYLTYSESYWNLTEFLEEIAGIKEDLENNVLKVPVRVVLVDQDKDGVSQKLLD